jgi:hypothetical protein
LISTAWSSGESNDTVAAEWMITSQPVNELAIVVAQPEAVGADVARHCGHPPADHGVELVAVLFAEPVERVVAEDFLACPLVGGRAAAWTHQQHQFTVGDAPQQAFDERGADESCGSRDGDAFAGE